MALLLAPAALSLLLFAVQRYFNARSSPSRERMNVARFTNTGRSTDAAISSDGKFVVYVQDEHGQQSLWVKQVATASDKQIISPANVSYQGLAFSPDGNYIFYNLWDKKGVGVIYRVPVLGGIPTRVTVDVMPTIAVSPDGRQIAFVRSDAIRKEQLLMIANTDGTGERALSKRGDGAGWFSAPAWSPDGKLVACAAGSVGEQKTSYQQVIVVPSAGGAETKVSAHGWLGVGGVAWSKEGRELVITATDRAESPLQVWTLSYPEGEARKITNDVNGYAGVSLTRDATSLVTVQYDSISNIWVMPGKETGQIKKVTAAKNEGSSLTWTPDNRIVYVSGVESGNPDIWIMDHDGGNKQQLTNDAGADFFPSVTGDGRQIIFVSNRAGSFHLWKMKIDGSNQQQFTAGAVKWMPLCSPTDQRVYYLSSASGKDCLWRVSLDGGGEPVQVTDLYTYLPAISPDGRRIAYTYWNEKTQPQQLGREIRTLTGPPAVKQFTLPPTTIDSHVAVLVKWAPDGKALTFVDNHDGVSNIWSMPLDGGPPKQLTNFLEDRIFWFDWSRDGQWLACSRGTATADVVLISNFH